MAALTTPVTTASYAPLGHDAATGEPVDYTAHDRARGRVCNGVITGDKGTGKSSLARRIADTLAAHGWTVRYVDASERDARDTALDALWQDEHLQDGRGSTDPLHLTVWDGLDQLLPDRKLRRADFAARLRYVAAAGPTYGIAQLAVTRSLLPIDFSDGATFDPDGATFDPDGGRALRDLLADNVLALPSRYAGSRGVLDGHTIIPAALPFEFGHAYALVPTPRGSDLVHVHLDGVQPVDGCSPCWRVENDRLGRPEQPPRIALADAVFAEHPPTGRVARWARGAWRFLTAGPGDETATDREVAELEPVADVLRVNVR